MRQGRGRGEGGKGGEVRSIQRDREKWGVQNNLGRCGGRARRVTEGRTGSSERRANGGAAAACLAVASQGREGEDAAGQRCGSNHGMISAVT